MYIYIKISHKYTYQYILRIFKHIQLLEETGTPCVTERNIPVSSLSFGNSSFADN